MHWNCQDNWFAKFQIFFGNTQKRNVNKLYKRHNYLLRNKKVLVTLEVLLFDRSQ